MGQYRLHVETFGHPDGVPLLVLHGGPGGCIHPRMRQYFDPVHWRVVLFDQRGCGQSTPFASIADNHTDAQLADMERLRMSLGIERWWLFGGSWGTTLALLYAQRYPERCLGLLLRGVFLCRKRDLDWLYGPDGAARLHPNDWRDFSADLPCDSASGVLGFYRHKLTLPDAQARPWAQRWARWEARLATLLPADGGRVGDNPAGDNPSGGYDADASDAALAIARLENHYFCARGFIEENQIIEQAACLVGFPGFIAHGRHDLVCPLEQADTLARAWPNACFRVVEGAGHSSLEVAIEQAILDMVAAAQELSR